MGTGENNFVGVGMGGGNPSYTITADADQDSPSAANITLQADGTPITPDSWALIRPYASSTTLSGSGDTVSLTWDEPGRYIVTATIGGVEVARSVLTGGKEGLWELVEEVDLTAEANANLNTESSPYTMTSGHDITLTGQGNADTWSFVSGSGMRIERSGFLGTVYGTIPMSDFLTLDEDSDWAVSFRCQIVTGTANTHRTRVGCWDAAKSSGFDVGGANTVYQLSDGSTYSGDTYAHTGDDQFLVRFQGAASYKCYAGAWSGSHDIPEDLTQVGRDRWASCGDQRTSVNSPVFVPGDMLLGMGAYSTGGNMDYYYVSFAVLRRV